MSSPFTVRRILALAVSLVAWWSGPAEAQVGRPEGLYYKSWGVVIAIDDYLVAPKLSGAVADGKAVAAALRQLGFEDVQEIYNQDARSKSLKAVFSSELLRKVGRQDRVVVFFAGHAGVTQDAGGKDLGYLVPYDAQPNAVAKGITLDELKEFSRRAMAKHILFVVDAAVSGWEVTPSQQLSLEGRLAPEDETDKRAVQLLTAGTKGETLAHKDGAGLFVDAWLAGVKGAADADKNGWLMATELGAYVDQVVARDSGGRQHPQFVRLDGDGDTILIEGKKSAFRAGPEPTTPEERKAAAKTQYELAFAALQQQKPKSLEEAMERLDNAIGYDPTFGDSYVMKSFLLLERFNKPDDALAAADLAVAHAAKNPDSFYIRGLILQRQGRFPEAEQAYLQALTVNPGYADVHLSLGDLYAQDLKDRKKAVNAYQRYLETGGTENRVREYLGKSGAADSPLRQ